jgi:hypothetical protein
MQACRVWLDLFLHFQLWHLDRVDHPGAANTSEVLPLAHLPGHPSLLFPPKLFPRSPGSPGVSRYLTEAPTPKLNS